MKKTTSLLLSALMICCSATSSACSLVNQLINEEKNKTDVSIDANYTELTEENQAQVTAFLSEKVAENTIIGDTEKDDWRKGLNVNFDFSYKTTSNNNEYVNLSTDASIQLLIGKSASYSQTPQNAINGFTVQSAGVFNYEEKSRTFQTATNTYTTINTSLHASEYLVDNTTYLSYDLKRESTNDKYQATKSIKVSTEELIQFIGAFLEDMIPSEDLGGSSDTPTLTSDALEDNTQTPTTPDTPQTPTVPEEQEPSIAETLKDFGLKVYFEITERNGLVLKVTATKQLITKLDELYPDAKISETIKFNTCDLELYLAIDANGTFKSLGLSVNVDFSGKIGTFDGNVKTKGYILIALSDYIKIDLPANLATDEKYVPFSFIQSEE